MFKILLIVISLLILLPFLFFYFLFVFPPTRKLIGYFLKSKIQNMSQNGHVYYRSYHFGNGETPLRKEKDVTPRSQQQPQLPPENFLE